MNIRALLIAASIVLALPATTQPSIAQNAPQAACTGKPNVPARVLNNVTPNYPQEALDVGAVGYVTVVVALTAQGRVTSANIDTSPSDTLNDEARHSAQASFYSPEIKNCAPVAVKQLRIFAFGDRPSNVGPVPEFSSILAGEWGCTSAARGPVVRVYLQHFASRYNKRDFFAMHLVRDLSAGAVKGDEIDEEHYVNPRDQATYAKFMDPAGFAFEGKLTTFARGDVTFDATAKAPHPVLRRLTYSLNDSDHYTRTLTQQMTPDAPFTPLAAESCVRMTPLDL